MSSAPSAPSMRRHVVSRPNVVGPADPGRPVYAFPETTLLFALIKDAIRRRCKLGSVPRLTLPTQRRSAGSGRGTQSSGRDFGRTLFFYNVISLVVSLCCASLLHPVRIVRCARHPQSVQQHAQLSGHGDSSSFLRILATSLRDCLAVSSQIALRSMGSQDVLG